MNKNYKEKLENYRESIDRLDSILTYFTAKIISVFCGVLETIVPRYKACQDVWFPY